MSGGNMSRWYDGRSKAITLCLTGYILAINDRCSGALSCGRHQLFRTHFPGRSLLTISLSRWNISTYIRVYLCLYYALLFQSFVEGDSRSQPGSSLTLARPSRKRLRQSCTCGFFTAALPYASSSIRNVSEGDLCSKTQTFIFAHCSVADIFKCVKPTIRMDKQRVDNDNNA
jgi:hypothetical protein